MGLFRRAGNEILKLLQVSADPAAEAGKAMVYAKLSGGATKVFMRDGAGTISEVGAGAGPAPSISMTFANAQSAGDLTTLGTHDWLHLGGVGNQNPIAFGSSVNAKRKGGWLRTSFTWSGGSNWTGNVGSVATATAGDNVNNVAISSNTAVGPQNFGGAAGGGFSFRVPASATPREVRWFGGFGTGNFRVTCTLDGLTVVGLDTSGGGETRIVYSGTGEMTVSGQMESTSGTVTCWILYALVKDAA